MSTVNMIHWLPSEEYGQRSRQTYGLSPNCCPFNYLMNSAQKLFHWLKVKVKQLVLHPKCLVAQFPELIQWLWYNPYWFSGYIVNVKLLVLRLMSARYLTWQIICGKQFLLILITSRIYGLRSSSSLQKIFFSEIKSLLWFGFHSAYKFQIFFFLILKQTSPLLPNIAPVPEVMKFTNLVEGPLIFI